MRTVEEINEIEEMYELLEGTANMLRGMMFDPSIKDAIISKVNEIDQACGKFFVDYGDNDDEK